MKKQIPKVRVHVVLTTRQGTAMPETAMCLKHFEPVLARKAIARAGDDWDCYAGFVHAHDNPELHCIECGE